MLSVFIYTAFNVIFKKKEEERNVYRTDIYEPF